MIELTENNHLKLANHLREIAQQKITANADLGGAEISGTIAAWLNRVWVQGQPKQYSDDDYASLLNGMSDRQKSQLLEGCARMGHLYEIAGLWARNNYFEEKLARQERIPGGVEETLQLMNGISVQEAVEQFNRPEWDMELTQHATNTNGLQSMRKQRTIGEAIRRRDTKALEAAIGEYFEEPLLHRNAQGKEESTTVRDETDIVLNSLCNIYDDMPAVYAEFDRPLSQKYGAKYDAEQRKKLKLNYKLGSWGSAGDKDGNNNITSENTLEAIILHKATALRKYTESLREIAGMMKGEAQDALLSRADDFERMAKNLDVVLEHFVEARDSCAERGKSQPEYLNKTLMPAKQFDQIVQEVRKIDATLAESFGIGWDAVQARGSHDAKEAFVAWLESIYDQTTLDEPKQALLSLARRARIFGFTFGKIEYRETSPEYTRTVGLVNEDYEKKSNIERMEFLTRELNRKDAINARRAAVLAGAEKPYSSKDAAPIAYHTLRRMELARDFPDMIQDSVIAECKGACNILEAKYVQLLAADEQGRTPVMGIVPLFEDPNTMQNVVPIMKTAYENPAYQQHLRDVAEFRRSLGQKYENVTQQVQIAHSDNARRSGIMAARGFIHFAHRELRKVNAEKGIDLQFYEGGSVSDAYRNGTRAISGTVDDFGLYDYAKFTIQGGDLLNYLNQSTSIVRLLSRAIAHQTKRLMKRPENSHANGSADKRVITNDVADDVAIKALTATLGEYETQDFSAYGNPMGAIMALLDYKGEQRAGQRGSRSGMRNEKKMVSDSLLPEPVENMRTIPFSEAWQHNGVVPTWIGSDLQAKHLYQSIADKWLEVDSKKEGRTPEENEFHDQFSDVVGRGLWPKHVRSLYNMSRTFQDAIDRAAYGVALTDTKSFDWLSNAVRHDAKDDLATQHTKNIASEYLTRLVNTFKSIAPLAAAAQSEVEIREEDKGDGALAFRPFAARLRPKEMGDLRQATENAMENIQEQVSIKRAYRDFLMYIRHHMEKQDTPEYWHMRAVLHNAGDTVVHGRMLPADDPNYGKSLRDDRRKEHEKNENRFVMAS